jgi:spore germination protein GerM
MSVYNKSHNWYHVFVAGRNRKTENKSKEPQAVVIFWLVFVIVIISVFMLNAETIERNFNLLKTRLTTSPSAEEEISDDETPAEPAVIVQQPLVVTVEPSSGQAGTQTVQERPVSQPTPTTQTTTAPQVTQTPQSTGTGTQTQTPPATTPVTTPAPTTAPAQTRDRNVYFTQIDKDGQILQSRVTRRVPVSDSPMVDALNVMFAGPSADELTRGILNLIPHNTRILSAVVRGNTAYISFSEDFLFNTFGVEGYVAQLRQIVWTVTEFSNVNDVQILIEGRRLDYLGEGIWIGSPVSRQSF